MSFTYNFCILSILYSNIVYFSFAICLVINVVLYYHQQKCIYYNWYTLRICVFIPKLSLTLLSRFFLLLNFLLSCYVVVYSLIVSLGHIVVYLFFNNIIGIYQVSIIIKFLFLLDFIIIKFLLLSNLHYYQVVILIDTLFNHFLLLLGFCFIICLFLPVVQ